MFAIDSNSNGRYDVVLFGFIGGYKVSKVGVGNMRLHPINKLLHYRELYYLEAGGIEPPSENASE